MKTILMSSVVFTMMALLSPTRAADEKEKPAAKDDHRAHATAAPALADEKDFVLKASGSGLAEVEMAKLADQQAKDAKVKKLAATLAKDHTAANESLAAVAKKAGLKIADAIPAEKQSMIDELKGKSGAEFDRAFVDGMAMGHANGIALYEAGLKVAKSDEIEAYIKKTLPTLREHARLVAEAGGKSGAGTVANPGVKDREPKKERAHSETQAAPQPAPGAIRK